HCPAPKTCKPVLSMSTWSGPFGADGDFVTVSPVKQRRKFSSCQRGAFTKSFTEALTAIGSAIISWTLNFN
ncbi:hypothetical protein AAKU64_004639, partial [Undibacterium sp. GrIS 1.8]|uniref:hypothetical protein n=1 Tax=Undibacterium sp. GrIS 1.8 TaxID=3143934 RepID=UPI003397EF18